MERDRKINPVVRKFSSFKEAEDADDEYWANTTAEERLHELISLRLMVFGDLSEVTIQKFVRRLSIYEEDD